MNYLLQELERLGYTLDKTPSVYGNTLVFRVYCRIYDFEVRIVPDTEDVIFSIKTTLVDDNLLKAMILLKAVGSKQFTNFLLDTGFSIKEECYDKSVFKTEDQ